MSKTSKDELLKELGKAQVQGIKEAAKEQAKEMGFVAGVSPGRANPLVTSALEQVAQQATAIKLNIQRRDPITGKFTYLRGPGEIDAGLVATKGLHEILDDWCGGGEYQIEILAPGQERITQNLTIGGTPQDPGYRAKAAVAGGIPVGTAHDPNYYFGPPRQMYAPPQQQDNTGNIVSKMLEMMMAKEMMASKLGSALGQGQSSSEVQELKAELARMREEQRRSEEERRRNDEVERLRREANEERKRSEERIEKLVAEMGKDRTPPWVPLLSAALSSPAISAFVNKGEQQIGLLSQTFGTVLQAQQASANQQVETFKMLVNRPSAADEISKMTGIFAQSQMTTMQMVNQIITSGLLDKGGGHPVVDLLSQLIEQGGQVLQSAVGGGQVAGMSSDEDQVQVSAVPMLQAAPAVPQLSTAPQASKQYDLNADPSFRVIMDQIRSGGAPREIALRLYRHGQPLREDQGHPLAKAWCRDPENYSKLVLEQIGVSEERISEITKALYDLAEWIQQGHDPEQFAQVETRRRKKKKALPSVHPEMQESFGYNFDPGEVENEEDEEESDLEEFPEGNGIGDEEKTRDLGPQEIPSEHEEPALAVEG